MKKGFIYSVTKPQDEVKPASYVKSEQGVFIPVVGISEKDKWGKHSDTGHFPCPHCGQELKFRFETFFMGKISDWSLQLTEYLTPPPPHIPMPAMRCIDFPPEAGIWNPSQGGGIR